MTKERKARRAEVARENGAKSRGSEPLDLLNEQLPECVSLLFTDCWLTNLRLCRKHLRQLQPNSECEQTLVRQVCPPAGPKSRPATTSPCCSKNSLSFRLPWPSRIAAEPKSEPRTKVVKSDLNSIRYRWISKSADPTTNPTFFMSASIFADQAAHFTFIGAVPAAMLEFHHRDRTARWNRGLLPWRGLKRVASEVDTLSEHP